MKWINSPCPFLPEVHRIYAAADIERFGKSRDSDFYLTCLRYAQSLWLSGFPAKAILLCNRALSSPLGGSEPVLRLWPLPYRALAWILFQRPEGQFLGNPRRHWQHLATRMVEPNKALRTWRAWACWYLAKTLLPEATFPPDTQQIRKESIIEPCFDDIFTHLVQLSPAEDVATWQEALHWASSQQSPSMFEKRCVPCQFRPITPNEVPMVVQLAHQVWHACYPGIISKAQIDYMLSVWYEPTHLMREISDARSSYVLMETAGQGPVGYLAFELLSGDQVLFLSKLYLIPELHGCGIGRAALNWLTDQARTLGRSVIRLRVNKNNHGAIRAYLRAGFTFVEDVCSDIGNGFVMDDYLMERLVPKKSQT